jgi:hypothetical protein
MIKRSLILFSILIFLACSVAYASGKNIDATISDVKLLFNGIATSLGSNYKMLNVNGNTYVPIRFVVEKMGGQIKYDAKSKSIDIQKDNQGIIVDPNQPEVYLTDVHLLNSNSKTYTYGNLHLPSTPAGQSKYVSGLISFFDSNGKKLGSTLLAGYYTNVSNKLGSLLSFQPMETTNYAAATLQIGMYGDKQISSLGDPSSSNDVSDLLSHFYTSYINKNFGDLINYTTWKNDQTGTFEQRQSNVAQSFINDRWWYGDIQDHKISILYDIATNKKGVAVIVSTKVNNKDLNCVDRFVLVKQNGEWLIEQYFSGSPVPEMP